MAKRIEELASILGVELEEVFDIYVPESEDNKCSIVNGKITKGGLSIRELKSNGTPCGYWEAPTSVKSRNLLVSILTDDNIKIKKKPFIPKVKDVYWFVDNYGDVHHTYICDAVGGIPVHDLCMIKLGNCYRSREEAERHKAYWKTVLNSDRWTIDAWHMDEIKIKCDFESKHDLATSVNAHDYATDSIVTTCS